MEKASSVLAALFGSREPAEAAATVTSIFVYPIKSCRGISVPQACVTSTGLDLERLQWDRQWLVVNSKGRAYTQRVEPKLALVDIELPMDAFKDNWEPTDLSYMVIKAPDMEALRIPLNKKCAAVDDISVWEWSGSALNEGNEAFEWFTKYLGKPSRLVRFNTELEIRAVDPNYAQGYKTLFTDGFPFLLASQGSLDGLNELLDEPLPINRFRPNILVDGCDPFSEDLWKELKINKLNFHGVKLCARCKVMCLFVDDTGWPWSVLSACKEMSGREVKGCCCREPLRLLAWAMEMASNAAADHGCRQPVSLVLRILPLLGTVPCQCTAPASASAAACAPLSCFIPTINQENGVTGNEPTSTLMKFRSDHALKLKKTQGKMFFGQNLVCKESLLPPRGSKTIAVGDPVFVLQKYSSNVDAPI
ncbi:hypothetical protein ZIOFF_071230 [Zingiber officinale]|uniref:MOSC domain-containing protein n=1 Tax=Zingiber officinale TaxID=94328 RepID=A0A8J5C3H3_ZINOF|nr:hypothetical protein ZIOFF_071230 [Zingiber officinale]